MIYEIVSIIMPLYNAEKYIDRTLESIINQTYKNWELIIIDDNSQDKSSEIISKYTKKYNIVYYKFDKNFGSAAARNKGIELARGRFIAFLDSDDIWYPEKLEKQILFMKENKYTFTYTYYDKIDEFDKKLNYYIKNSPSLTYSQLLRECPGNSTVIYDALILGKFKISNIKKRNDYLLWLSVIKKSQRAYCLPEILSSHRIVSNSISSNKKSLIKYHWEIYKKHEKLNIFMASYLVIYWIIKTIFKKNQVKIKKV